MVAAVVAAVVDRSLRLSRRSARATAEAETMSSLAGSIVRGGQTIPALLERTRETFGMASTELVDEPPDTGNGTEPVTAVPAGPGAFLVLRGRTLSSSERRVLAAFAAHVGGAVERARLAEAAAEVEPVKAADRMRTALLRAVGHDLRTPLAAGWAAVASLRSSDVAFSPADRDELLATADESMAKLNQLVENLLDLSRLQTGVLTLNGAIDGKCTAKSEEGTLCAQVVAAKAAVIKDNSVGGYTVKLSDVPADAVTSSGSGLDPDISPSYADLQVHRIAEQNGLSVTQVDKLVKDHTSSRILGFMGEPRVNVLELNVALKELVAKS